MGPSNVCMSTALNKNKRTCRIYAGLNRRKELVNVSRSTSTVGTTKGHLRNFKRGIAVVEDGCYSVGPQLRRVKVSGMSKVAMSLKISSCRLSATREKFSCQISTPLSVHVSRHRGVATESVIGSCDRSRLCHIVHSCNRSEFTGGVTGRVITRHTGNPVRAAKRLGRVVDRTVPVGVRGASKRPSGHAFRTLQVRLGRRLSILQSALSSVVSLLGPKKELYVVAFRSLRSEVIGDSFHGGRGPYVYPDRFPIYMYKGMSGKGIVAEGPVLPSRRRLAMGDESGDTGLEVFRHTWFSVAKDV